MQQLLLSSLLILHTQVLMVHSPARWKSLPVSGRVSVLWGRVEPILTTDVETGFKNSAVRKEISGSFEVSKLTYAFPDSQLLLFDKLSLSIPAGKYTAITGPSGCGKSTLMKLILGVIM